MAQVQQMGMGLVNVGEPTKNVQGTRCTSWQKTLNNPVDVQDSGVTSVDCSTPKMHVMTNMMKSMKPSVGRKYPLKGTISIVIVELSSLRNPSSMEINKEVAIIKSVHYSKGIL